jgi:hypothetical protein
MGRIIFELAGFFFLPFLAYAAFVMLEQNNPAAVKRIFERRALLIQTFIGLLIVAGVLIVVGLTDPRSTGAYKPAVFKDGVLVPGRVD